MNYYNDNDPNACAWLRGLIADGLIPAGEVDCRSIADIEPNEINGFSQCHFFAGIGGWSKALRLAGWPDDVPVWTGSCPCQPFSCAGKRAGTADKRHLWPEFARLIRECHPPTVFGEQVASKDGRKWLAGVRSDLEGMGYGVGAADLCSAGVGAPNIRQRLYWVANTERQNWRAGRMGNASHAGLEERRCEPGDDGPECPSVERTGGAHGRMADSELSRSARFGSVGWPTKTTTGGIRDAITGRCGLGFWSASRSIPCLDGKTRRVPESVFQPLAPGLPAGMDLLGPEVAAIVAEASKGWPLVQGRFPNRAALLRGIGNAINVRVAAEFIAAGPELATAGS